MKIVHILKSEEKRDIEIAFCGFKIDRMQETLNNLRKALEAGGYNAMPSELKQGQPLEIVELPDIHYDEKHIIEWKKSKK